MRHAATSERFVSKSRPSHKFRRAVPANQTADLLCYLQKQCGGCKFINQGYAASLKLKYEGGIKVLSEQDLLHGTRLFAPSPAPKTLGYRAVAKLAVRPDNAGEHAIGLFRPHTHELVDIPNCPVHMPAINAFVKDLKHELADATITPYNEQTRSGDLRYLVIRAAHLTGELMVVFVVTSNQRGELREILGRLRRRGHSLAAAYMHINASEGNAIFAGETVHLCGATHLRERLCGLDFDVGPTTFFQINPWQAEIIYQRIIQLAGTPTQTSEFVWDLYTGTGQIASLLAKAGYRVLGVEENPEAVAAAQKNADRNHLQLELMAGKAELVLPELKGSLASPFAVVVNPSRRGLAPEVRKLLKNLWAQKASTRLIYLACDLHSFARDLADFQEAGARLKQLEAFDMFPQTDKLEWLGII